MIGIGLAGALVDGLLSLLSPCSVLLLPAWAGDAGRLRTGPWIIWMAAIVFVLAGLRHRPGPQAFQ